MGSLNTQDNEDFLESFLEGFYSDDILKENAPKVDVTFHLDKAYLRFNFPSIGSSMEVITKVNYRITEYGSNSDGTIDRENILDSFNSSFSPHRVPTAMNEEDLPLHDAWYDLNASWYEFQFEYMYYPEGADDGSNVWYSNPSRIVMDNLQPRIFDKAVGKYIIGDLKTALIDDPFRNITMWYETDAVDARLFDAIKIKDSTMYKQANPKKGEGVIEQISHYSLRFWLRLFNNEEFLRVVAKYVHVSQVVFRLEFNHNHYTITINGDLNKLVTYYWRDYFEDSPLDINPNP